jgi:hypothetical protein
VIVIERNYLLLANLIDHFSVNARPFPSKKSAGAGRSKASHSLLKQEYSLPHCNERHYR